MKKIRIFFLCLVSASIALAQDATTQAINGGGREVESVSTGGSQSVAPVLQKSDVLAKLSLIDGSTFFCKVRPHRLQFTTAYGQKLKLDPETVESIVFETEMRQAVVHFRNGDRLSGAFEIKVINVKSLLGKLDIPLALVKDIKFTRGLGSAPSGLIYWNTFESETDARSPKIGMKSTLNAGSFVKGIEGNALHTQGRNDNVSFLIPPNTFQSRGCIEFWAKLDVKSDTFGGGTNPRFFWLSTVGSRGGIRIDYSANNGVGSGGLTAIVNNISCGSLPYSHQHTYRSILGNDASGWHHYALVWNRDGIDTGSDKKPSIGLYLDGNLVSKQTPTPEPLGLASTMERETMLIIAPSIVTDSNTIPFAIDELKIWNYDKTEFGISKNSAEFRQCPD